tara:strand:- start:324 stop:566 length:243 start_codon:yes stop_codon:yes gene_type:complete
MNLEIIALSVIALISSYIIIGIIKHNAQIKKDERFNSRSFNEVIKERDKVKSNKKVSKNKTQNKRKYNRTKKTSAKSKLK